MDTGQSGPETFFPISSVMLGSFCRADSSINMVKCAHTSEGPIGVGLVSK